MPFKISPIKWRKFCEFLIIIIIELDAEKGMLNWALSYNLIEISIN